MPFQNPILAGEELIRSAIRSENFVDDTDGSEGQGWRITRDGNATFNAVDVRGNTEGQSASYDVVSANSSLIYRGVEMGDYLNALPHGIIAYGELAPNFYVSNAGAFVPLLEVDTPVIPGRLYRVYTNKIRYTSNTGTDTARLIWFYTVDGSQPVPFSGSTITVGHSMSSDAVAFGGRIIAGQNDWVYYADDGTFGSVDTRLRVVLVLNSQEGQNLTTLDQRIQIFVEDMGAFSPFANTGINRYTGSPPPPLTFKTLDIQAFAFRSYTGAGAYDRADFCFQGTVSPVGNRRSMAYFDLNATGSGNGGTLNDMVGVPGGQIAYIDAYAFFPHWWNSSGGEARIGYDTNNLPAIGAPQPGAGFFSLFGVNYPGRNVGIWFPIIGTPIHGGIEAGTFRSLMFGPGPNNSNVYYGYASDVRIRAGYYK